MTVCIAAIYGDGEGVVLASDRMVTAHVPIGYEFERQGNSKILSLSGAKDTHALTAGDVLRGNEILKLAQQVMEQRDSSASASEAAEIVRSAYQQVRRTNIAHEELEPRGLDINGFYARHQQLSTQVVQIIDNVMCNFDLEVEALVAGPNGETYTIHTILNPGTLIDNSAIGHGAIGSGSPHALYSLIENSYETTLGKDEVIKLVRQAKQRSEVAPGVGKETTIVVMPHEEGRQVETE